MGSNEKRKIVANEDGNSSSQPHSPKRRIIGPSLPSSTSATTAPGEPLSDRESDSESDDDFGPTLPPSHDETGATAEQSSNNQTYLPDVHQKKESQRDQWMLQPPDQSNWASKIDPTQIRNRKFQTGRSARSATSKQVDASWMESPEERMRRLGDEVMGVGASSDNSKQSVSSADAAKAKLMEDKIKKFNEQTGKKARLETTSDARKEDDDPSTRAFDREKDMAVSSRISNAQRREMVNKASGYNSRFTKGDFL